MAIDLLERFAPMGVQRDRDKDSRVAVRSLELIGDLVLAFAMLQLAQLLLAPLSALGAGQMLVLFLAFWLMWSQSAICANLIEPNHPLGRVFFWALTGLTVIMAASIERAFAGGAFAFAAAYVALSLVRTGYVAAVFRDEVLGGFHTYLTYFNAAAGLFWFAGALFPVVQMPLWAFAVILGYAAPYAVPRLTAQKQDAQDAPGLPQRVHLLARLRLFLVFLIAMSLVTLAQAWTAAGLSQSTEGGGLVGLVILATLWWVFFAFDGFSATPDNAQWSMRSSQSRLMVWTGHAAMALGVVLIASVTQSLVLQAGHATGTSTAILAVLGVVYALAGYALLLHTLTLRVPVIFPISCAALVLPAWQIARQGGPVLILGICLMAALGLVAALARIRAETPE